MTVQISDWSHLSEETKTILERVDINRRDLVLQEGKELNIPYFKGIITKKILNEIKNYEDSQDNEGYFKVDIDGNDFIIRFLKGAFD